MYDRTASADEPALLLSGGALLVGDLARPDLLGGRVEAEAAARTFCIGSRLSTTVGYERRTNAILANVSTKDHFVEQCLRLDDLPAVPPYWRRMRRQNLGGVPLLGVLREPPALPPADVQRAVEPGAVVLDTRSPRPSVAATSPAR